MANQQIIWTALPNGTSNGGDTLSLSVQVSPRLSAASPPLPDGKPSDVALSEFPDFLDWPALDVRFRVRLAGHVPLTLSPATGRRSDLWLALFNASTPVQPYDWSNVWIDPSTHQIRSYPVAQVRSYLQGVYSTVAAKSGANWPSLEFLLQEAGLNQILFGDQFATAVRGAGSYDEVVAGLQVLFDRRLGAIPPDTKTTTAQNVVQASLFLAPFVIPALPPKSHPKAVPPHPQAQLPNFDFHQALSLLANHPPLMRLLGLVYDLEMPRPAGLPTHFEVSVEPLWSPHLAATSDVSPKTMTAAADFRPRERSASPELAGGYVRFGDPEYSVVELDVDGATLKALNFVQGISNAQVHKAGDTPTNYATPSLRSAGLSVARSGNALALGESYLNANDLNNQVQSSSPPTLYAEDLTRGFRVDVWDDHTRKWHSLCARVAAPRSQHGQPLPRGYLLGSPAIVVPVPGGDEGWIQLGVTSSPQGSSGNQNLPETLFRWSGWSLAAARPGAHLKDDSSAGLATNQQSNPAPGFPVTISYAAAPGTLPTLRFGRTYYFRARAVDLAGNSVAMNPDAKVLPLTSSPPARYLRFEPVASPLLLFQAPRTPGEHLELLVIRSNYDIPNSDPSIATCQRQVVPPPVAEEMAEAYGLFDDASGRPQPSVYAELSARAGTTYNDAEVVAAAGAQADPNTQGQYYYPNPELAVPYLPDPSGRGAALLGLPGTPLSPIPHFVPFFAAPGDWPVAGSFRLVVRPGAHAPEMPSAANQAALSIYLPKGMISEVRLSCYLKAEDLAVMGLAEWLALAPLTPAEKAVLAELILAGRHWMFTPYRTVTLVHAVRQPLIAPHFGKLTVSRQLGSTYATLDDTHTTVDHRSSVRLDVLADWNQPYDDGHNPAGSVELSGHAHVGQLSLEYEADLVLAAITGMRHEFGDTIHRQVFYQALATSRFLEYFAETKEVTLSGQSPQVVDVSGFAQGATQVTGTGSDSNVVYRLGVDYGENDSAGSITRIAGGDIADGASVEVRYVTPPVTRSSLEHPVTPAGPGGYLLSIPNSARPVSPDVRYLLPAFGWRSGTLSSGQPYSFRGGNVLRVYLGRPWWSSGQGELLGVVLAPPLAVASVLEVSVEPQLQPLFTRVGGDPLWESGPVDTAPGLKQFPLAVASASGVVLAEQHSLVRGMADIAGHKVEFDPVHGLWFADIQIDAGSSYWPFVRLGLVRFQPASLRLAEVSTVVQTDFAQLTPNRLSSLSFPSPSVVSVNVAGPGVAVNPGVAPPVSVRVFVDTMIPGVSDSDLQWELANPDDTGTVLTPSTVGENMVFTGLVALPSAKGSQPFRIRIQEAETMAVDVGAATLAVLGSRITYVDTFQI